MGDRALILFAHGARDARWATPFQRLQQILQARLPDVAVRLAFLELMSPRLPELVQTLEGDGCTDVTVTPVFFGQGGHVLRDLPLMLDEMRKKHPGMTIKAVGAVGEDAAVLNAIADYCAAALGT